MLRKLITLMSAGMILLAVMASAVYANVQEEWAIRFGGSGNDEGLAIAKDSFGNVYMAGYKYNGSTYQDDWFIAKYDIMGTCLWQNIITNPGNDTARAIVIYGDAVYVAGERRFGSYSKYYTVKSDCDSGGIIWATASGVPGNDFKAYAITANSSGVFVAGEGWIGSGITAESDIWIYKYDPISGAELGGAPWDGSPAFLGNDYAMAITTDGTNVYVAGTGFIYDPLPSYDLVVLKYDQNLNLIWPYIYDGPGGSVSSDMAWDIAYFNGHVYVAGTCDRELLVVDQDYITLKLNTATPTSDWIGYLDREDDDVAFALAVYGDAVYVTGKSKNSSGNHDYATVKYFISNGAENWTKYYNHANGEDMAMDIAVNQYGVYVTGRSEDDSNGDSDYATVAYERDDGGDLWEMRYSASTSLSNMERANAIVADYWNVWITGGSTASSLNGLDIATIRYNYGPWIDLTRTGNDTIPPEGDSLRFTAEIGNMYWEAISGADVRVEIIRPNGSSKIVFARSNLILPPEDPITRYFVFWVPAGALPGTYTVRGTIGDFNFLPNKIYDQDSFTFVKLGYPSSQETVDSWEIICPDPLNAKMDDTASPQDYGLGQNYPNPFNPSTVLSYQLPVAGLVRLEAYDTSGRFVARLVNGWREAGSHKATFDGSSLPSGIYIYRIEVGDWQAAGKMILLK